MIAKPRTPKFSSEAQERQLWEAHDSANLVDWVEGETRPPAQLETFDPKHLAAAAGSYTRPNQGRGECARRPLPISDQSVARRKALGMIARPFPAHCRPA